MQLLHRDAASMLGCPWKMLLTPAAQREDSALSAEVARGGVVRHAPVSCVLGDGTVRLFAVTMTPLWNAENVVVGSVRVLAPRADPAPASDWATARRLASIIDNSDDAIAAKDLNGIVTAWNRAAEAMFGYTAEEMIGQSIRKIIPPDRQSEEDDVLARIRRGDKVDHFETVRQRKDGTLVPISLTVSPIADDRGTIVGASKIARDIRDRKRLAAIVDSSDDAIVGKTLDGIVTSWNRAAETMFGYTAEEMIGQSIRKIIPDDRQSEEDDVLARIRRGLRVEHFDTIRQRKDGTMVPISLSVSPIHDERGFVVGASKIARDISDRKAAEAERARLLAVAERNAAITEKLNRVGAVVAATLDGEAVVQAVTDAATDLTTAQFGAFFYNVVNEQGESYTLYTISGVPREQFVNFPMPRNTAVFEPTFRGAGVIRSEDITKDPRYGKNAPYRGLPPGHLPVRSYLAVPVKTPSGYVLGGLFFGHPEVGRFTEEHEQLAAGIATWASVALENARLYRGLLDASRLKDEFLATLSHELRTPLNAILGYARMLRTGLLNEGRYPHAIETIERNAASLTQIVEDVLDVSRIVAGKMRLNIRPVDLGEVVRHAVEALQPTAELKTLSIRTTVDPGAAHVAGDPDRLQQVVWNLVSNAIKFTDRGGRVDVRVERADPNVAVVVADTGTGIAPEFLPHVFERFRQEDAGAARIRGGLGLGLSIVQQLVELHGGTVTAASDGPGKGATFRVTLPVVSSELVAGTQGGFARSDAQHLASVLPDLSGLRVLAIDDEPDALAMVRDILEARGALVTTATSADGALEALAAAPPDVVVADLAMPHVDGFALIARIRQSADPAIANVPAAALTAFARSDDRQRAVRAGYQVHLSKPIDPAELIATVRALSRRR